LVHSLGGVFNSSVRMEPNGLMPLLKYVIGYLKAPYYPVVSPGDRQPLVR